MKLGKIEPLGQAAYAGWMLATGATILTEMSQISSRADAALPLTLIGLAMAHYFYSHQNTDIENIKQRLDKIEPRENEVELKVETHD